MIEFAVLGVGLFVSGMVTLALVQIGQIESALAKTPAAAAERTREEATLGGDSAPPPLATKHASPQAA